jgi:DNA-binding beta-propeller fold protein YncE
MSHSKNPRLYIALTLLLISAILVIARDHRPSFLRPNLRMYAYVSTEEGALTVVDLIALRPIAKIPVGPVIADLREHATRPEIWGVSNGGNYVFVLDTTSNQLSRIPVGPAPYSIDFSPSGDRVYTTASGSDQLVAIDTVSRQIYGRAHTNPGPVQARITPDAKNILVVNRRSSLLSIHDARTLQLLSSIAVVSQPDEVLILTDSKLAFVASRTQKRLSVANAPQARRRRTLRDLPRGSRPANR